MMNHDTYLKFKENAIQGRYVINEQIATFLECLSTKFSVKKIGVSVENRTIKSVSFGIGKNKILMWSQMHGNESTTTKAVIDLIRFLASDDALANKIYTENTITIIPILNPDGAQAFTRVNASKIDLNRDAQDRNQPESEVLRRVYDDFKPDFCFNLHDQRTIFNVGATSKPATISFLAPSHDESRSISKTRAISMQLIAAMNTVLQNRIPGQVGRYDDGFNANCVGDTFQMLSTPTILFEAGHYPEDYQREKTREYIFHALIEVLRCISFNEIDSYEMSSYFDIPENSKQFFDVKIKNAQLINPSLAQEIGILYKEVLMGSTIVFEAKIEKEGDLKNFFGHQNYDCSLQKDVQALKNQNLWNLLQR